MRSFVPFALRDLVVLTVMGIAWWLEGRWAGVAGMAVAIGAGALTTVVAFLGHEWGHLTGCWLSGARVHAPAKLWSVFLFFFDVKRNDRRQFLALSWGGYVASLLALAIMAFTVPTDRLAGWVAWALTAVGIAVTFALEVPATVRVMRGAPLPRGAVYVDE